MTSRVTSADRVGIERFLGVLFGSAASGALVEVRFRVGVGMRRSFHPASALDELRTVIAGHADRRDVFVGVVPRVRRGGGRNDLVEQAAVLWADCDGQPAVAALADFEPEPSMVVASGSGTNCHAYWLLSRPVEVAVIERLNRRVSEALGADVRSSDGARILRPAGSANWKSWPPAPVRLVAVDPSARVDIDGLNARLPASSSTTRRDEPDRDRARVSGRDPLLQIAPRVYVEALTNESVGRGGKLRCPFHDDHSPSLHVFEEPERGWFCFGCGRGGSVYDFAALLWGSGLRGKQFVRLRQDLTTLLLGADGQAIRGDACRS